MMITVEKELIREDSEQLKAILGDVMAFRPSLAAVKVAYERLDIGPFTDDTFHLIKGGNLGDSILNDFHSAIDGQLSRAGVSNEAVRNQVIKSTYPVYEAFVAAVSTLRNTTPTRTTGRFIYLTLDQISFVDGDFTVSAEERERIAEAHCRLYLNAGAEAEFLEAAQALFDAYSRYKALANKAGVQEQHSSLNHFEHQFITGHGSEMKLNPGGPIWLYRNTMRIREAARNGVSLY